MSSALEGITYDSRSPQSQASRHEDDGDHLNVSLIQYTLLQHLDCRPDSDEFAFKSVYADRPHTHRWGKTFGIRIIDWWLGSIQSRIIYIEPPPGTRPSNNSLDVNKKPIDGSIRRIPLDVATWLY